MKDELLAIFYLKGFQREGCHSVNIADILIEKNDQGLLIRFTDEQDDGHLATVCLEPKENSQLVKFHKYNQEMINGWNVFIHDKIRADVA